MNNSHIKLVSKHKNLHDHILFKQNNYIDAITIVCLGSIHGNEPAGRKALQQIKNSIETQNLTLKGNFYALEGNRNAIKKGIRFENKDLNRLWSDNQVERLKSISEFSSADEKEQYELYVTIKAILSKHQGPFVFIDLHTTSAETIPFITISDSLNNREIASQFKLPIILGIEESIDGPLLTYINEFGHTSLGFEAGQHDCAEAVNNCEAFVWLMMEKYHLVNKTQFPFLKYHSLLYKEQSKTGFYEITFRYALDAFSNFKMNEGFYNFDPIDKGQTIALNAKHPILAEHNGFIFMPLYQDQGNDGYFIVNQVSKFWLQLSTVVRKYNMHKLLPLLPGVKQYTNNEHVLIVNKKIAAFLTTKIFHLFGYRKKILKDNKMHFIKRDRKISAFL